VKVEAANNLKPAGEIANRGRTQLRKAADEVVGQVFYGTMLRQLRSSTLQGKYGHGGRGEEVFQAQLDQVLANRAGAAQSSDMSDAIVKRYGRRADVMDAYNRTQQQRMEALRNGLAQSGDGDVAEVATW